MLVRPCVQNVPGKIGEVSLSGSSLYTGKLSTGKRPRRRPRTTWRDYISVFARSLLSVEPAEQSEIAVDREVFRVLLRLLPRKSSQRKTGHERE